MASALLVGALLIGGPLVAAVPGPVSAGATLVEDSTVTPDGRLHQVTLHSEALGAPTGVRVLLPAGYDDPANAARRYPVLLLLHGAGGDETSWTELSDVEGHTAGLDLIVVMPDGGSSGFYSDWIDGPAWESYHVGELVPWVDATYRTAASREGRAVGGLSMGGFGAMAYAARHPDLFVSAASFSGALDIADGGIAEAVALQALGIGDDRRWGPYLTKEVNWRGHNPADLVTNLRSTRVRVTTATGVPCAGDRPEHVPIEAGVFLLTTGFQTRAAMAAVPLEAELQPCGTHAWNHWDADLRAWLPSLTATFADPPPRPAAFDHRAAERTFSVWDWTFAADRPVQEFTELQGVSPAGFTATGSGDLAVTTSAAYQPGRAYRVASTRIGAVTLPLGILPVLGSSPLSEGSSTTTVIADADGRLRFSVDLGPAHGADQYSPGAVIAQALAPVSYFQTATVTIVALT